MWGYSQGWRPDRSQSDLLTIDYYVMKRLVEGEPAGEALSAERQLLGTGQDIHWANIMGMNLYGSPITRFVPQATEPPAGAQVQVQDPSRHHSRPVETWTEQGVELRAEIWEDLILPKVAPGSQAKRFRVYAIYDPAYPTPWLLATPLKLKVTTVRAIYQDRWPVEQIPLATTDDRRPPPIRVCQ